jgi:hypothetical protein
MSTGSALPAFLYVQVSNPLDGCPGVAELYVTLFSLVACPAVRSEHALTPPEPAVGAVAAAADAVGDVASWLDDPAAAVVVVGPAPADSELPLEQPAAVASASAASAPAVTERLRRMVFSLSSAGHVCSYRGLQRSGVTDR